MGRGHPADLEICEQKSLKNKGKKDDTFRKPKAGDVMAGGATLQALVKNAAVSLGAHGSL